MKVNMNQEVRALKKWLESNPPTLLAYKLGYRDCGTVKAWIARKAIPLYQIERIRTIINNGDLNDQQLSSSAG